MYCRPHTSIDKQTRANGFSSVTVPAQIVDCVDRQTAYAFHFCRERRSSRLLSRDLRGVRTFAPSRHKETRGVQKDPAVRELHSMPKPPFSSNDSSQWIPPSLTISLEDQALAYYYHHAIPPIGVIEAAQGHDI